MTDTDSAGRAWDWLDDAGDVIVRAQPAIACYLNRANDIVLRQHGEYLDDDAWIWFRTEHAFAVARAIMEAAGLDNADLTPEAPQVGSKPKDSSGAERQRRYRDRQKKESTPDIFDRDVTDRDVTRNGNGA